MLPPLPLLRRWRMMLWEQRAPSPRGPRRGLTSPFSPSMRIQ
uniref:Uncharacterized protein n=1 Tax=Arundo donax TaxID=35708 RepID=A0A0A9HKV7_ARUDO